MFNTKPNLLFAMLVVLLSATLIFSACGGDESDTTDGDIDEQSDGDNDGETYEEPALTPFEGRWELLDTNAVNWYKANSLQDGKLYLIIQGAEFMFLMIDKNDEQYCTRQEMSTEDDIRFLPLKDADNCWYDLEIMDTGHLIVQSRNRNDPEGDPENPNPAWYFQFIKVTGQIEEYDYSLCNILDVCTSYFVQ